MKRVVHFLLHRIWKLAQACRRPDFGVTLAIMILIGVGIVFRFYFSSDFEFKKDQLLAVIAAGNFSHNPLGVPYGMPSSAGVFNFPGFYQLQIILGWFGHSIEYFHWMYIILSLATVAAVGCLRKYWPYPYFSLLILWAAVSPVLIYLSGNIWAQCFLPLFSILIVRLLADFLTVGNRWYWVAALLLTLFAMSVHMAGLLILPGIFYFGWRQKGFRWQHYLAATFGALAIFGYYFYSFLSGMAYDHKFSPVKFDFVAKIAAFHEALLGGIGFWLFPEHRTEILREYFSSIGGYFLLIAAIAIPLWLSVLAWRRWTAASQNGREIPALVRVSGVLTLSAILILLVIQCYFYYFLIILIPVGVLLVYGSRGSPVGKYALLGLAAVQLLLVYSCLDVICDHGGDHEEYGISFALYRPILLQLSQQKEPVQLRIRVLTNTEYSHKIDPEVLYALFQPYLTQKHGKVATLDIGHYEHGFVLTLGFDQ